MSAASSCHPKHCDKQRAARCAPTERCCKATLEFAKQIDNTVSSSSCVVQDSLPASPYSLYKQRESYCTARDAKRRCCQLLSTECRTRLPCFWYFFKKYRKKELKKNTREQLRLRTAVEFNGERKRVFCPYSLQVGHYIH